MSGGNCIGQHNSAHWDDWHSRRDDVIIKILNPILFSVSLCLSHSLRNMHIHKLLSKLSLTARLIWLDSVRRAIWCGASHYELSSPWVSPKKLLNLEYKMWSSKMPLYSYAQPLWKTSDYNRGGVTLCCYNFLSALMTFLFTAGDDAFIIIL